MGRDFLLEIGTEEIPSGYIDPALCAMENMCRRLMEKSRIEIGPLEAWGTPRRLALMVRDMAEAQREVVRKRFGPPFSVAYDEREKPTKAAKGFAERCGVTVEELRVEETEKGRYVCAVSVEKGKQVSQLLPELVIELISQMPFPKAMRWGEGDAKFVRPVHWLLCLYGSQTVEFQYAGIVSGNRSWGHRFMAPHAFTVKEPLFYTVLARENFVIVENEVRKEEVRKIIHRLAAAHGGLPYEDDELVGTVTNLVEYPVAVWGSFDEGYLKLPRDVLINAMMEHQRYFPVERGGGGLMPNFIAIGNTEVRDPAVIARGNEKVLRARLEDAMFFFKEDTRRPLEEFVHGLKHVLYQEKLGTSYEKMERFSELALHLQRLLKISSPDVVERAARLCKADLMSQMVYEYPKLQGIMGREYALLSGEREEVAAAIYEHYLPGYSGDSLPTTPAGAILSIADKLDTIAGSFGVGMKPTGNEDPHGLRRQTLGIISIILRNSFRLSLADLVGRALGPLKGKITEESDRVKAEVLEFFARRMESLFLSEGFRYDLIDAAMGAGYDDIVDLRLRIGALTELSKRPDFEALTTTFKRVVNIIQEERVECVQRSLFTEEAEERLFAKACAVESSVKGLLTGDHYLDALTAMAELKETVDYFFDKVLVMVHDEKLRHNRLALLSKVAELFSAIADFSKVVVSG